MKDAIKELSPCPFQTKENVVYIVDGRVSNIARSLYENMQCY